MTVFGDQRPDVGTKVLDDLVQAQQLRALIQAGRIATEKHYEPGGQIIHQALCACPHWAGKARFQSVHRFRFIRWAALLDTRPFGRAAMSRERFSSVVPTPGSAGPGWPRSPQATIRRAAATSMGGPRR
jgi:hypothetical protein